MRNDNGSTTFSLILPTLLVTGYLQDQDKIAQRVAEILNAHWDSHGQPDPRDAQTAQLAAALRGLVPTNLCTSNANVADDALVPIDATMGEVRAAVAALAATEASNA
ncbi:hypothetical protein [Novosphingobium sp. FKTRR1]|uniref:hypothetical protein n=1 Tax=Novosphingobium sp. FKTRR1 TaxID=2879118 RepID=UPI001CEFFC10|nr:hypothetical protein [Novosphingobium sp. FKTRR1]